MSDKSENNDLSARVLELEKFKHEVDKKLYAAIAVAMVLGVSAILSGALITSLTSDLAKLSRDTSGLEQKVTNWNEKAEEAISTIELTGHDTIKYMANTSATVLKKLEVESEKIVDSNLEKITNLIENKKSDVLNIGVESIINSLNNGKRSLIVKSVSIINENGITALYIGADKGGDGLLRLSSDRGELRYILKLIGNRPSQTFYNTHGNSALSLGVYSNDDIGFARFRDKEGDKTLLELTSDRYGGKILSYSVSGESIVYLGPNSNTGSGLVNVMGIHGEKKNSHEPTK